MTYAELVTYLTDILGDLENVLAVTATDYQNTILNTMLDYGVTAPTSSTLSTDVPAATNLRKLLILSRMNLWKYAMGLASSRYKFSADGGSYDRNQMYDMCKQNYELVLPESLEFSLSYQVTIEELHADQNPYAYNPDRVDMRSNG